jgi:ribosomal-protein-alanine N-acetyltransferase
MNPDSLRVRAGSAEDVQGIAAIEREAAVNPWSLSQFVNSSLRDNEYCLVLEAETDGLLGFLVYQRVLDEATLMNIAVLPHWQGGGCGAQLLDAMLGELRSTGVRRCVLEVRCSNIAAIALYRRYGFVDDGVRSNYYPTANGREDALLMSRLLQDRA